MKPCSWKSDKDLQKKLFGWWNAIQVNRKFRAELSRAVREDDIFQCGGYYLLRRMLKDYAVFDPALARTASVLSRIRRDRDGESFGMLLGQATNESRIKRLSKKSGDRLTREFCGLVKLLRGEAPLVDTADVVYWWEVRHPNRDFLYDFYSKETVHAHV